MLKIEKNCQKDEFRRQAIFLATIIIHNSTTTGTVTFYKDWSSLFALSTGWKFSIENLLFLQVDFWTNIVHFDIVRELSNALFPKVSRSFILEYKVLEFDIDHILSRANYNGFFINIFTMFFHLKKYPILSLFHNHFKAPVP